MRITSQLFVAHLVRRVFGDGGFAAVIRTGADMAGAIFVVERRRDGALALYGPAVQSMADEAGGRTFMREAAEDEAGLTARFEREARFDPDFWVVEIETDSIENYIDIV